MTKEDHSMVQERRISIIVIRANGRKERRKIARCFKKCNCLLNKNLQTLNEWLIGNRCLRSNLSALNKEKNIMPRCADSWLHKSINNWKRSKRGRARCTAARLHSSFYNFTRARVGVYNLEISCAAVQLCIKDMVVSKISDFICIFAIFVVTLHTDFYRDYQQRVRWRLISGIW